MPQYPLAEVEAKIDALIKEVEKQFQVKVERSAVQRAEAAPPTKAGDAVVQALDRAIRAVKGYPARMIGIGGGTVAAIFRAAGLPAAVWSTIEDTAHQPDESALISYTLSDAKVMLHVFLNAD